MIRNESCPTTLCTYMGGKGPSSPLTFRYTFYIFTYQEVYIDLDKTENQTSYRSWLIIQSRAGGVLDFFFLA